MAVMTVKMWQNPLNLLSFSLFMGCLILLNSQARADFNMPYAPDFENSSRIRTMDGASCEARTAQATVQVGVYDSDNTVNLNDSSNLMDSQDSDRGVYAQISVPLDLGGGRKPDCSRFQEIMEESAELDLQLKKLEVELKMAQLKKMKSVGDRNSFSE